MSGTYEFDAGTTAISEFAAQVGAEDGLGQLSPAARSTIVSHFVDAMGCGIAALETEPGRLMKAATADLASEPGASVLGERTRLAPEAAAFVNASLVRTLDLNDVYNSRSGGHPSNVFPGILAVAEAHGLGGVDVMRGIHAGTEVYGALCDMVSLREQGWDAGPFVSIATAAGVGALLRFDAARIGHAVSLAATSAVHLGVIRAGTLSAWKGCAEGQAVMTGVWFARLAGAGITGPAQPFAGATGFLDQVAAPMDFNSVGTAIEGRTALERSAYKFRPVQWTAQAPVEAFVELSPQVDPAAVEEIVVAGSEFMCKAVGGARGDTAEKWDPQTRETADHSLPFLTAVALVDGEVTLASYERERLLDPQLRPLMRRVKIVEDPGIKRLEGGRQPFQITITLNDGQRLTAGGEFAHGHWTRPPQESEIDQKFRTLTAGVIGSDATDSILGCARQLEGMENLGELTGAMRSIGH